MEIVCMDIADVDIRKNMGGDLEREEGVGDKKIGEGKGEEGGGMGVGCEEEMKGRVEEMRGKVV
ncbi:flotillin-like FloA family protein, partial [Staphylococcus epidermidis]|uniref:flotillin-like FloA family protein n=1 Tax=Staphylococcus epidermidis TaxID=1282 RepID=UPI0021B2582A